MYGNNNASRQVSKQIARMLTGKQSRAQVQSMKARKQAAKKSRVHEKRSHEILQGQKQKHTRQKSKFCGSMKEKCKERKCWGVGG